MYVIFPDPSIPIPSVYTYQNPQGDKSLTSSKKVQTDSNIPIGYKNINKTKKSTKLFFPLRALSFINVSHSTSQVGG